MKNVRRSIAMTCLAVLCSVASGQDAPGRHPYSSFGFNVSTVSGLGLSYRRHFSDPSLFQISAGLLTTESRTHSALGIEYQYELSKKTEFRYYLAAGAGLYRSTVSSTAAGIGVGLEMPILGTTIFESLTGGAALFYPVAYSGDNTARVSFGGSIYFYYNF